MNLSLSLIQFAVLWQSQMLQVGRIKLGLLGHLSFLAATWVKSIRTTTDFWSINGKHVGVQPPCA